VKLTADILGAAAGPRVQEIDARWLMAYAAALGHTEPEYFDTTRPDGIISHPHFPVCYEWPVALDLRACAMSEEIARHSVHATHDLRLHRRPRAGDRLSTTATIVSVEHPGAPDWLRCYSLR
jgi:MaoC dehydratase-like protein